MRHWVQRGSLDHGKFRNMERKTTFFNISSLILKVAEIILLHWLSYWTRNNDNIRHFCSNFSGVSIYFEALINSQCN